MQSDMMNKMDDKEFEKKIESEVAQSDQELSTSDPLDSTQGSDAVVEQETTLSSAVKNTVHVQHAHSFQTSVVQTTVLPRALSEQSKLRILTRAPAVHSMSSTQSEESNEDISAPESETRYLKHQTSSKDADSESGPPSLSSSRDSSFDYTDSTGTDLNDFIMKTLKNQRDKKMLLKLEKDFLGFIQDPRKVLLQYPPMTSYHRMIVHRVAAYFGLDHNVDPTGKCIIVNKCPNTRYPEHRFTDLVREDSEEDPSLPKQILQRQNSLSDDSGPSERSSHSRRSMEGKKSKSIEEREEEYKKARSRIFNHQHGSLSSQSSASSRDSECIAPCSIDIDSENEKVKSNEYSENVGDKMVEIPQPAVRVLTNRSRSPDDLSKLTLDVTSNLDASSSSSSATLTTTIADSSVFTRSVDSAEGAPYITRNIPGSDPRSKMLEMIPQLSPNQTGGVVWTLPENQAAYHPSGQQHVFPAHETGGQMVVPDGFQPAPAVGIQQAPTFFFPNQTPPAAATFQGQATPRQATPPLQQNQAGFPAQVLPMAAQFVQPTSFPVFQPPRVYSQQDLEMLTQQNNASANAQGVQNSAGSPASNYQELSSQFGGISLNEQQENSGFTKPRGFSSNSSQTFQQGQPVQFMVYRNISGGMVVTPVSNPGQVNPPYIFPSPNPHPYTQPGYYPQMFNQVYTQQPFNQGFSMADQTLLTQGSGSHTPPPPSQSGSPLNTNPGFMQHIVQGNAPRPQLPTPVLNPGITHLRTRLMTPYAVQAQQVVSIPGGQQLHGYTQSQYAAAGLNPKPNLQQSSRYKAYVEKGANKNDIYTPESSNIRGPSPSESPRGTSSTSSQNRRSGGGSSKGHGKSDGHKSQYQQSKGKQRHKKSQHRHSGDSRNKQFHSGSSDMENTTGSSSCVLEVYDVTLSSRDQHQVVDDLLQAGAKIKWNEKPKTGGMMLTAKATFSSSEQAEQALMANSNPNYKLRRCPADIPYLENQNY